LAYWSHGVGWNYRSHELTAALARSGLRRLDFHVARAQRNARILDAGLEPLPGLIAPHVPADRTCSFYRYRIRIDADAFDFAGPPRELRDRLLWALRAEGVAASLWQLLPLPAQPVFRRRCFAPWQPGVQTALRRWDPAAHPNAMRLLEGSIVLGTARHPLWAQPESVARSYVEAFHKVLGDLETVLCARHEPVEPWPPHA
jgi:perosamine synthetase